MVLSVVTCTTWRSNLCVVLQFIFDGMSSLDPNQSAYAYLFVEFVMLVCCSSVSDLVMLHILGCILNICRSIVSDIVQRRGGKIYLKPRARHLLVTMERWVIILRTPTALVACAWHTKIDSCYNVCPEQVTHHQIVSKKIQENPNILTGASLMIEEHSKRQLSAAELKIFAILGAAVYQATAVHCCLGVTMSNQGLS